MGRQKFNPLFVPWVFAGDLVVANMQMGAVLWHRLSAPPSGAEKARMINEKIAAAAIGAAAAKPALKTVKANAKRLRKRSTRKDS